MDAAPPRKSPPTLFSGALHDAAFADMKSHYPTRDMPRSSRPFALPDGAAAGLPERFDCGGDSRSSEAHLQETDTAGLLALKDGAVRLERYALTGGRGTPWISWSVAKSFTSALVGIAVAEGLIESIEQPISDYATRLKGSAYDGVSIKNVLQMSSGARWVEDYSDRDSDIHRLGRAIVGESSMDAFLQGVVREVPPGTRCQYNSADTQALGALLIAAAGRPLADYMAEKLAEPLGFEHPGFWLLDHAGTEMALGGLNLIARDYAKFGELYRQGGVWRGEQILPRAWVEASLRPDAPHLHPGETMIAGVKLPMGYGYQWWLPEGDRGEFCGIGVYNQYLYVDPSIGVTIVKNSANRRYGVSPSEADNRDLESLAFLRAVARSLHTQENPND